MENLTTINLTPEERKDLLKTYADKIESLQNQLTVARDMMLKINRSVDSSVQQTAQKTNINSLDGYDNFSIHQKIIHALDINGKCMNTKQIVEYLKQFEKEDRKSFYGSISGILSAKIKKKQLFSRYMPKGGSEYYIGLIEWFSPDGKIIEQYKAK